MSELGTLPEWVSNPDPDIYLYGEPLILDWECTNIRGDFNPNNEDDHIVCGSWEYKNKMYSHYGNELEFDELLRHLEECDYLVAHNWMYELGWLTRCGFDITKIIGYDTQIGEYVIAGNRNINTDLNSTSRRYGYSGKLDTVSRLIKAGVCPSQVPRKWLLYYNREDVRLCKCVLNRQREVLKRSGLLPTQYTRCLFTPVLVDIQKQGMKLDSTRVQALYTKMSREYNEVLVQLNQLTGGINPNSPKQVSEFVYDVLEFQELTRRGKPIRTEKGGRKADSATLLKLKARTPEQKQFVELKKKQSFYNAKLTKGLTKFQQCCEKDDGMLYARFNQTVTQTHRLSSTGLKYRLQFQNFDREFKPLFKARKRGWKIGEVDQAQLEWRVIAYLSQDPEAIRGVVAGEDVHGLTTVKLFSKQLRKALGYVPEPSEVKKVADYWRSEAKPDCFPTHTEYLTPLGWKGLSELCVGDKVLAYDQSKNCVVEDIILKTVKPFNKEVVEIGNSHWKFECTKDHRWFVNKRKSINGNRSYVPAIVTAENLDGECNIITAANYINANSNVSADDAARVAWIESDGTRRASPLTGTTSQGKDGRRRAVTTTIIQKKEHNFSEIRRLFTDATEKPHSNDGCLMWAPSAQWSRDLYSRCRLDPANPDWISFVLNLSEVSRKAFLRAVIAAEGHDRGAGVIRVGQNSGNFCEAIKLAGFLNGHDIRVSKELSYTGKAHERITLRTKGHVTGQRFTKISRGIQKVACIVTKTGGCIVKQGDVMTISHNTFGPVYGKVYGTPEQMAYFEAFRSKYPTMNEVQEGWTYEVLNTGKLVTQTGLIFYWPGTFMNSRGQISNRNNIFNYPVQSFAGAEIVPVAVTCLWHRMKSLKMQSFLINTVHDSAIAEVAPKEGELYTALGKQTFTEDVYNYLSKCYDIDFNVPLEAEVDIQTNWHDSDRWKTKYLGDNK